MRPPRNDLKQQKATRWSAWLSEAEGMLEGSDAVTNMDSDMRLYLTLDFLTKLLSLPLHVFLLYLKLLCIVVQVIPELVHLDFQVA